MKVSVRVAKHIEKFGGADLNAQRHFALNPGVVGAVLAAIAVTSPSFTAGAQDLPNLQPIAQVIAATGASPATDLAAAARRTSSRTGQDHRLFFGFVEFDWDPSAPGGVPGFGPLPEPTHVANR